MLSVSCSLHQINNLSCDTNNRSYVRPTIELNKIRISATYLGSAQLDQHAESRTLADKSDTLLLFVSPEWLSAKKEQSTLPKIKRVMNYCVSFARAKVFVI